MEWISVEDRLPERGRFNEGGLLPYSEVVLVWAPGWDVEKAFWERGDWIVDDGRGTIRMPVTHWMPLPDPPQDAPESS